MTLCSAIRVEPAIAAAIDCLEPVVGVPGTSFSTWVPASMYSDPDSKWSDEALAYDSDTDTGALNAAANWGHYLELGLEGGSPAQIYSSRMGIWCACSDPLVQIDIDIHSGGGWSNIHSGVIALDEWVEIDHPPAVVDKMRIKVNGNYANCYVDEAWFAQKPQIIAAVTAAQRLNAETDSVQCT